MGNNSNDDDWFKAAAQPGEVKPVEPVPSLSVVPASPPLGQVDDWFSATGQTDSTAGNELTSTTPAVQQDSQQIVEPSIAHDWVEVDAPAPAPTSDRGGPQKSGSWLRRHRATVAVGGSASVLIAAVAAGVATIADTATVEEPTPITALVSAAPTTSVQAAPVVEGPWCEGRTDGYPITAESADRGEASIARFQNAYYIDRDGARAREVVAPDARVASVEGLNAGISQIPVGTEHCVLAKKIADGVYAVDVFERRPDTTGAYYDQAVTTTPDGALITAITEREGA